MVDFPRFSAQLLSVIVYDLNVAGVTPVPHKANAVLIIDSDAMLSYSIVFQGFEPVSGQRQVAQGARLMQGSQLTPRHHGNILKFAHRLAIEDCLGLFVPKAPDHY
jgi:hypothetical protein